MANSPFDEPDESSANEQQILAAPQRGWSPPPPGATWPASSAALPPIRLHHLFALTAVVAVLLGVKGPQSTRFPPGIDFPVWWKTVLVGCGIIDTILCGIAVTLVAYGCTWRRRGIRFLHQPGHWLLVEISVSTVILAGWQVFVRILSNADNPPALPAIAPLSVFVIRYFVHPGLNIYIGWKECRETRWKWVFFSKALAVVVPGLGDLLVAKLLLQATRLDHRRHHPRDTGHYWGVWLQLAIIGVSMFFLLVSFVGIFSGNLF